ncbi:MAG TPA: hypothetical protein VG797_00410 [Phycisphaerales bacterium]|nr:hypothetical protein [Phycisphaerales bacterium]
MPGNSTPLPAPPPGVTKGAPGPRELALAESAGSLLWLLGIGATFVGPSLCALLTIRFLFPTPVRLSWPIVVVVFAASFGAAFWYCHHLTQRWKRALQGDHDELAAKNYRICLDCRYDLGGLADAGVCPECGAPYSAASLKKSWRWTYESGKPQWPFSATA